MPIFLLRSVLSCAIKLGMEAKKITRELKKVGGVKSIAQKLGVKQPTVSQVIHGIRPNPRIREAIAQSINKQVSDLWPEQEES